MAEAHLKRRWASVWPLRTIDTWIQRGQHPSLSPHPVRLARIERGPRERSSANVNQGVQGSSIDHASSICSQLSSTSSSVCRLIELTCRRR
jgi:hypothetical protein